MNLKDAILPYGEQIHTGTPDSILAALYRDILSDLQIDESRFILKIGKHVERNTPPQGMKEISSIRGNVLKELMKSMMTWKVFTKGLSVLNIRKFEVSVKVMLKTGNVRASDVSLMVLLDPNLIPKDKSEISKPNDALTALLRGTFEKLNITTTRFTELIGEYIVKANIPVNMKEISSARGNIKKELLNNSISWKVFIKGLVFLNAWQFIVEVRLHHFNGKVTQHSRTIVLDTEHQESL